MKLQPIASASGILKAIQPIPGWLTDGEATALATYFSETLRAHPAAPVGLEIGSYCGRSTAVLGLVALEAGEGRLFTIDPHLCGPEPGISSRTVLQQVLHDLGLDERVTPIDAFARNVEWSTPISFLFIDGAHDYFNAHRDFSRFQKHVVDGGFVAFHDYGCGYPGVTMAVDEIIETEQVRVFDQVERVIILQIDRGLAERPRSANSDALAELRTEFEELERTISARDEAIAFLKGEVAARDATIASHAAGIEYLRGEVQARDERIRQLLESEQRRD